jgi:hypothetical protein
MSDNLTERVQILGHAHIIYITVLENRIICCQIFCDLLLKSAFERNFNVMQLILVKIKWHINKWKYLIQKFHDICLSYYFKKKIFSEKWNEGDDNSNTNTYLHVYHYIIYCTRHVSAITFIWLCRYLHFPSKTKYTSLVNRLHISKIVIQLLYIVIYLMKVGARVAQRVRSLDLTAHTSLSPIRRGFAPNFENYKKGALDSQPQVIKFTSCLPMVGGSLRVLRLPPPLNWSPWYSWIIAESGAKYKNSKNSDEGFCFCL